MSELNTFVIGEPRVVCKFLQYVKHSARLLSSNNPIILDYIIFHRASRHVRITFHGASPCIKNDSPALSSSSSDPEPHPLVESATATNKIVIVSDDNF
jgi:hypothetical protein